jgi:hypothetical protein
MAPARAAALSCLAVLAAACGDEPRRPAIAAGDLPHAEGTSWTYRLTREAGPPETLLVRVDGTREAGGQSLQRLVLSGAAGTAELFGRVDRAAVLLAAAAFGGAELGFEPVLEMLPLPFELGRDFRAVSAVPLGLFSGRVEVHTRAVGFGSVTASGRQFADAFRLHSKASLGAANVALEAEALWWLAPGVGLVRAELLAPPMQPATSPGRLVLELVGVDPDPAAELR